MEKHGVPKQPDHEIENAAKTSLERFALVTRNLGLPGTTGVHREDGGFTRFESMGDGRVKLQELDKDGNVTRRRYESMHSTIDVDA